MTHSAWPSISVVTPSFNQAHFLRRTLESVHSQNYPLLEHLVLDGGSSDSSREIIEEFAPRLAFWVSEPDQGQTDALARGFARATGDIFCWLNSDDLFQPRALEKVAEIFRSRPEVDFLYGDSVWIDRDDRPFKLKREQSYSRFVICWDHNFIPQPSTFWRSRLYRQAGGVDRRFNLAMDADLWVRMAEISRPVHVAAALSAMRFYGEQKNTRYRAESLKEMEEIRSRYYPGVSGVRAALYRFSARLLRVAGKARAGGYPLRELSSEARRLAKRETWESEQLGG